MAGPVSHRAADRACGASKYDRQRDLRFVRLGPAWSATDRCCSHLLRGMEIATARRRLRRTGAGGGDRRAGSCSAPLGIRVAPRAPSARRTLVAAGGPAPPSPRRCGACPPTSPSDEPFPGSRPVGTRPSPSGNNPTVIVGSKEAVSRTHWTSLDRRNRQPRSKILPGRPARVKVASPVATDRVNGPPSAPSGRSSPAAAGEALVGLDVAGAGGGDDLRRAPRGPAGCGPSRASPTSRARTACRTRAAGGRAPSASAGQNRDESGVSTSSASTISPVAGSWPNSSLVSATRIPLAAAVSAPRA